MAKYGSDKGGGGSKSKLGWQGIAESTPSADPKPLKGQGGFERQDLDYRGIKDSTPYADGVCDKVTLKK